MDEVTHSAHLNSGLIAIKKSMYNKIPFYSLIISLQNAQVNLMEKTLFAVLLFIYVILLEKTKFKSKL